ncbi:protease inhibitor, partial [Trifolium pratense]
MSGNNECQGKESWPELVGVEGKVAAATIEKENPSVNAIIVLEGTGVTK